MLIYMIKKVNYTYFILNVKLYNLHIYICEEYVTDLYK